MSFNNGPTIVTNGLVLALDAGDRNSYPGSGTTWRDLSGNNNNGTLTNGPTFNSANLGSIVFDGVDDFALLSNESNFDFERTTSFSIDCWVNLTTITSNDQIIISKLNGGAGNYTGWEFGKYFNTSAPHLYLISNYGSGNYIQCRSSFTLLANTWYNVVCTYNGSSNTSGVLFYVNGQITSTIVGTNNLTQSILNNTTPTIARRAGTTEWPWNGLISTSRIYNRALSSQEILQNYNATKTRFGL